MSRIKKEIWCLMVAMVVGCAMACATDSIAVDYGVGLTINTGGSEFAPYYIASNCRGTVTQRVGRLVVER